MLAEPLAYLPFAPRPRSGLRAPAPHPGPGYCLSLPQGPTRSAILRAPSPTRTACRRAAGRAGPAGRGQRAVGGTRGASVGCWEEGTPHPPPSQARPRLLFSPPGTSYRCFSDELRPTSGLDRTVPLRWSLGVPGRDRLEKAERDGVKKSGGRELSGFVYLGGSEFVTPPSALRCVLPSAPAHY